MNENVALAMRQVAEQVHEDREKTAKMVAEQWADNVALSAVKQAAERGEFHLDIQVPNNIHKAYAEQYLATGGFTIDQFGREYRRYIRIKW